MKRRKKERAPIAKTLLINLKCPIDLLEEAEGTAKQQDREEDD